MHKIYLIITFLASIIISPIISGIYVQKYILKLKTKLEKSTGLFNEQKEALTSFQRFYFNLSPRFTMNDCKTDAYMTDIVFYFEKHEKYLNEFLGKYNYLFQNNKEIISSINKCVSIIAKFFDDKDEAISSNHCDEFKFIEENGVDYGYEFCEAVSESYTKMSESVHKQITY
jgi:hypothetical protein